MKNRVFSLFLTGAFCLSALAPVQAGMFKISPSGERRIGEDASKQVEAQTRVMTGPVADWVERVGNRLVEKSDPEFKYSFRVIDSPEINAFALPSGYIYVFSGLSKVARNDDELAAVLAHEITHAEQHHYARQYAKASKRGTILGLASIFVGLPNLAQNVLGIIDFSMTQRYSRVHESESDRLGMERMVRAGYDPQGMVSLLQRLQKQEGDLKNLDKWFADHPAADDRVRKAQAQLQQLKATGHTAPDPEENGEAADDTLETVKTETK